MPSAKWMSLCYTQGPFHGKRIDKQTTNRSTIRAHQSMFLTLQSIQLIPGSSF